MLSTFRKSLFLCHRINLRHSIVNFNSIHSSTPWPSLRQPSQFLIVYLCESSRYSLEFQSWLERNKRSTYAVVFAAIAGVGTAAITYRDELLAALSGRLESLQIVSTAHASTILPRVRNRKFSLKGINSE